MATQLTRTKLVRTCTVAQSVGFFDGMVPDLQAQGYDIIAISSDGQPLRDLASKGVRPIPLHMERHISPVNDLKSLWRMYRILRRERPQIVHSMTPKAGLITMMAAFMARVPNRIHTFTGLLFPTATGLKRRILMATDAITCACATHVIPEGQGVKNDLLNNHITRKDIQVLGHGNCRGIDPDRFDPQLSEVKSQSQPLRHPGKFNFIFIGRIVGDKGINELAQAFTRLYALRPDANLTLVGPYEDDLDPVTPETRHIIDTCPAIQAVGPQQDVRPWLAAADALVFPSYREGFPNVVIEAGAMGLPSIVTDINGSREIIINGENGLIIPPRDSDALLQAMRRLMDNPDMTASMASKARPLVISRYAQSYVRECLYSFYKSLPSSQKR